jgi:BirA family biotin operon repressor/biotin-[acetyl-CoA-carboxylase] ligase
MLTWNIRKLDQTSSTNDDAKHAAESGAEEGLVVWALQQSAGRGRQGRQWQSPEGNLYCSILLRPKVALREWGKYSFVAALVLYEAVHFYVNARGDKAVELKWPNDVLVNGKKISGILLESGKGYLAVGMGLNVRQMPENPIYPVTSFAAERCDAPLDQILNKILEALDAWYSRMNKEGFAPIRTAWLSRARRGVLRVRQPNGDIQGQFADLDEEGNLRLILADGTEKSFSTGDVFF